MGRCQWLIFAYFFVLYNICALYFLSRHGELSLSRTSGSAVIHNHVPASPATNWSAIAEPLNDPQDQNSGNEDGEPNEAKQPLDEQARIAKAASLLPSILDPSNTSIDRMACPAINTTRYGHLRPPSTTTSPPPDGKKQYFFALNLRQCVDLLPRLLGSLLETIRFLGPAHCALSIVEGNSDDGTLEVLRLLTDELKTMGVEYWLASSTLDPSSGLRIRKLAKLRAMAIEPVTGPAGILNGVGLGAEGEEEVGRTTYFARPAGVEKVPLTENATVVFVNDVAACAEDLLELVHQRVFQGADMMCAMDWNNPFPTLPNTIPIPPIFYDVWIARSLTGSLLFDIPASTGSWARSTTLFFDHPPSQARFNAGVPTQVFSCWNGAVAMTATPFVNGEVGFRWSKVGECYQGEPQLLCKDLWWRGYGRIAVVPGVNLEYTDKGGRWVKKERGYVSDFLGKGGKMDGGMERIEWVGEPPEMVNCVPQFTEQRWLPWNESLP